MDPYNNVIPIPKDFWSVETEQPFQQCSLCDCNLLEEGTNYMIEKAVNNGETIFEYAMCFKCHAKLSSEFSEISKTRVRRYFEERVNLERRLDDLSVRYGDKYNKWVSRCMVTDKPRTECKEYQLYGYFVDQNLVFNGMPYLLCSEVIEELLTLLSSETLGTLNDFSDRLFGIDMPQSLLAL